MKKRMIFTLLIFCSLLTLLATLSPTVTNAQQDEEPEERTAQLGENRGSVPEGDSEIWTYQGQTGDVLTIKAQDDDSATQCTEGLQLFLDDKPAEALPLLEASFALRESTTFANPDDEGICALVLGLLRDRTGNQSGALEAYHVALDIFQASGNRSAEGITLNNIGEVYRAQGQYELALEQYALALSIMREISNRENEGITLNNIGGVYRAQGKYDLALEQYQQALQIFREVFDQASEGQALNNIGSIYENQGQYELALEQYIRALEIHREVGDRASEGRTLNNIGQVYQNQGQYEFALEQYYYALEIYLEVGDRAGERTTLNNIGSVYHAQGQYELALQQYSLALEIRREVGHRAGEGSTLNNIGTVYLNQGQYELALQQFQQALEIYREVGHRAGEGTTLNNIGVVYREQGQYLLALEQYQQALEIRREVGHRAGEGTTANDIGALYREQGQYELALEQFNQALLIRREVGDRAGEGLTLNNIAEVYRAQGKYDQALASLQQSLEIRREVGDGAGEGETLDNIGDVYRAQGKYDQALVSLQQALEISREVGNRAGEGATANNIGAVYLNQGQYELALQQFQQALEIRRQVGDRTGEGRTLNNIGQVYLSQERLPEAQETFEIALEIAREVGARADEGAIMGHLGEVYLNQERLQEALETFQQALAILREVGDRVREGHILSVIGLIYQQQGQSERALASYEQALLVYESVRAVAGSGVGQASFIAQHADLCTRTVELFHQEGKDAEAFLTSERCRARVFLDSLATGYIQLSDNEAQALLDQEREAYAERQAIQDALARARALDPPDSVLVSVLEKQLAKAEAAYVAALAAVEARGDQLATLVPSQSTVLTLSELQALLDEQTTLVSYHVLADKGTLAFVITQNEFTTVELPNATSDALRTTVTDLHEWLNRENRHPLPLRDLHTWLIAPLREQLQTPLVGIIPHQVLHYVPFAALTDGEQYLIYDHAVFLLPSASVLPLIQANRKPMARSIMVLGNPEITEPLPDLPSAEEEAKAIANLYGTQPLVEKEATESEVRTKAGQASILHLAANADYDATNPLDSAIYLADDSQNDGRLEVHEVYELDLSNTNLVVLSGSRTQVGALSVGDEITGFSRAFMFTGASSIVASQWNVHDQATALLMENFHTYLLQTGEGEAMALRRAQIELSDDRAPFYWASFVLTGLPGDDAQTTELVPAETILRKRSPWPWIVGLSGGLMLVTLLVGLTTLSYSSGLPPIPLIQQGSRLFKVARKYPPYRERWQRSAPLTQLIILLAPLRGEVESKQLLQELDELDVPVESEQLENELGLASRYGFLQRLDSGYCLLESYLTRALQIHEGPKGRQALAKKIRDNHPLCLNALAFLGRAGFTNLTLVEEPLIYCCTPTAGHWQDLLPATVYVRLLPGQSLNGQQVRDIRRQVRQVEGSASVVFAITDQRPTNDGWGQIATLQIESFTLLPIESALINEGLAASDEQARLRKEIDKRRGDAYDPYHQTRPVTGVFTFFGRDLLVKMLLGRLSLGQPVGIFGLRKLGKSSLLYALQERASFPAALVNLETIDPDENVAVLYQRILDELAKWTRVKAKLNWQPPTMMASDAPTGPFVRAIRDLLGRLEKEQEKEIDKEARLGIFLDEIELLVPQREHKRDERTRYLRVLRPLRGLVDEGLPLSLVVAGSDPALNQMDDWQGEPNPVFNLFEEINLQPLAKRDCKRMIGSIGAQINLKYSEDALEMISTLSGGHPFLARQLCSLLYKRRQRDKEKCIEASEVADTVQTFIYDKSYVNHLVKIWQNAGNEKLWGAASAKANQSILLELARVGGAVPSHDLLNHPDADARREALINLEGYHFIYQAQKGSVAIQFDLLQKWLRWRKLGLE